MNKKEFVDKNGLIYIFNLIKNAFAKKKHSHTKSEITDYEDYELPTASAETLGGVKVGAGLAMNNGVLSATGGGTADSVDWDNVQNKPTIPTNNNQLTNGAGYQTSVQVQTAITNALSNIQGISYSIVTELPALGQAGVIYLISNGSANSNSYDEYIYVNDKFERIGTTEVDLTGYLKETDLQEITNEEIDELWNS